MTRNDSEASAGTGSESDSDSGFAGYSRRRYLEVTTVAGLAGVAGCLGGDDGDDDENGDDGNGDDNGADVDPATDGDGPNYEEYEGTEVTFATSSLYEEIWRDLAEEFESETGIEVNITSYAQSDMLARLMNQFSAQQAEFDAFIADVIWTGSFMEPEFAEPLEQYMEDPDLAMADYEYDDHLDVFAENYGQWQDTVYGLPWYGDVMKLVVRKDILEEYEDEYEDEYGEEIMPPYPEGYEDWDEFNQVAEFMYDQGYEMSLEGQRGWNIVYKYPNRFAPETGEPEMVTEDGESLLDTDGSVEALQHYIDQVEWARNPLSSGYDQSEEQFLSGETWAVEQWGTATDQFIDEHGWEEGVRVTLTPGGYPNLGGWGVLINTFSDPTVKEAAFLLAQWATSAEMDERTFLEHGVTPTRASSFTDEVKEESPQAQYQDPEENPGIRDLSLRPRGPEYEELGDTMQTEISDALSGEQDAEETIETIHESWESILN